MKFNGIWKQLRFDRNEVTALLLKGTKIDSHAFAGKKMAMSVSSK